MFLRPQNHDINKKITMADFKKLNVRDYQYVYPGMKQSDFNTQLHLVNPNGTMVFNARRSDALSYMVAFSGLMDMTKDVLLENKQHLDTKYKDIETPEQGFEKYPDRTTTEFAEIMLKFLINAELDRREMECRYYNA